MHPLELTPGNPVFILDVHLGKLARRLRMLGFDSLYLNTYTDTQIVEIASNQTRIVLTRDVNLLKHKVLQTGQGYWLRSQNPDKQLIEVLNQFKLYSSTKPFFRCINCNGIIQRVVKETVLSHLEPDTILYFHEFYQCNTCGKVYWKGSHYEKIERFIANLNSQIIKAE